MHPFYLFFFYPFGSKTGQSKEYYTKKFGVERISEQSRCSLEIEQYLVYYSDIYPPFLDSRITIPINIYDYKQNTQCTHEVHHSCQPS